MRFAKVAVLALLLMMFTCQPVLAGLKSSAVPGGVVIVDLGSTSEARPEVTFGDKSVLVMPRDGHWYAIVGIPLSVKAGHHDLDVSQDGISRKHRFQVQAKKYPEQRIKIKDKGKVDLSKKSLDRVYREKKLIDGFKASWSETDDIDLNFSAPVDGPLSSRFGLKRFFNDKPRRPHSGLDFAVPEGTPIKAPASGTVVGVGDFFFNGKAVFVDHGQGLISLYGHMSRIDVSEGQAVTQGDVLGAVGKTGRATGAHLHWTILLNRTAVDPELFIDVP